MLPHKCFAVSRCRLGRSQCCSGRQIAVLRIRRHVRYRMVLLTHVLHIRFVTFVMCACARCSVRPWIMGLFKGASFAPYGAFCRTQVARMRACLPLLHRSGGD